MSVLNGNFSDHKSGEFNINIKNERILKEWEESFLFHLKDERRVTQFDHIPASQLCSQNRFAIEFTAAR